MPEQRKGVYVIDDKYAVVVKEIEYALAEYAGTDKRTGEPIYRSIAYLSSIPKCLQEYKKQVQHDKAAVDFGSIDKACQMIQESNDRVSELISQIANKLS